MSEVVSGVAYEVDLNFLEHARHEACEQPELPWDALNQKQHG